LRTQRKKQVRDRDVFGSDAGEVRDRNATQPPSAGCQSKSSPEFLAISNSS
jgi:hypothetical protein